MGVKPESLHPEAPHLVLTGPPGSGKTTRIISEIVSCARGGGRAIILAPSRALMNEIRDRVSGLGVQATITNMDYPIATRDLMRSVVLITSPWKLLQIMATRGGREDVVQWMKQIRLIALDEIHAYLGEFGKSGIGRVLIPMVLGFWGQITGGHRPRLVIASATLDEETTNALTALLGNCGGVAVESMEVENARSIIALVPNADDAGFAGRSSIAFRYKVASTISHDASIPMLTLPPDYLRGRGTLDATSDPPFIHVVPHTDSFAAWALKVCETAHTAIMKINQQRRDRDANCFQAIIQVPWRKLAERVAEELRKEIEAGGGTCFEVLVHHGGLDRQERVRVETLMAKPGKRIIVTCFTLQAGLNIPGAHLLIVHPRSVSVTESEGSDEGQQEQKDTLMSLEGLIQMMGRVGRPPISDPAWAIVLFPSAPDFEYYRNALAGMVSPRSMEWNEYALRTAISSLMAMLPHIDPDSALNTFVQHTVDYYMSEQFIGKEALFVHLSKFWDDTISLGNQAGLFRSGRWSSFGRSLLASAMPLRETLIPFYLASRGDLGYEALIREIYQLHLEMGAIDGDRFGSDDLDEVMNTGLLVYQTNPRLADLAEGINRSLALMASTAKMALRNLHDAPQWVKEIDVDVVASQLEKFHSQFVEGGHPQIVVARQMLKGDRYVIHNLARRGSHEGLIPAEHIFGDLIANPMMGISGWVLGRRIDYLAYRIAKAAMSNELDSYSGRQWLEETYDYLTQLLGILETRGDIPAEAIVPFLPVERVIKLTADKAGTDVKPESVERIAASLIEKLGQNYQYAILTGYRRLENEVQSAVVSNPEVSDPGALDPRRGPSWPAILVEPLVSKFSSAGKVTFERRGRGVGPVVFGRFMRRHLMPGDVIRIVAASGKKVSDILIAAILPEVFNPSHSAHTSFVKFSNKAYQVLQMKREMEKQKEEERERGDDRKR